MQFITKNNYFQYTLWYLEVKDEGRFSSSYNFFHCMSQSQQRYYFIFFSSSNDYLHHYNSKQVNIFGRLNVTFKNKWIISYPNGRHIRILLWLTWFYICFIINLHKADFWAYVFIPKGITGETIFNIFNLEKEK